MMQSTKVANSGFIHHWDLCINCCSSLSLYSLVTAGNVTLFFALWFQTSFNLNHECRKPFIIRFQTEKFSQKKKKKYMSYNLINLLSHWHKFDTLRCQCQNITNNTQNNSNLKNKKQNYYLSNDNVTLW